jgi:glycosyltransferase involved in cell wall biosynthesis
MRVALLTNFIPPYRLPLLRALREQMGELRIFVSTKMERNRQWRVDWSDLDVVVQRTVTLSRTWKHSRFTEAYQLHIPIDTIPQLARYRPDVIITAEFGMRTGQAIAYAKARGKSVIVWATLTEHLEQSRNQVRQVARGMMVRAVDRIVVNGESGARYIRGLGAAEHKIVKIPQTTDLSAFQSLPLSRDADAARDLLCVGMVSQLKGSDLLIDALQQWAAAHPERQVRLTMLGEGPLRAELQQRHLPNNLSVEWAAPVQYDALPAWYGRAGMLIFPTQGDEWGLVVNEALAAGLPIIGSEYSQAVDELLRDGENGWRFRPDDPAAIASAIDRALRTPDGRLEEMRRAARATVAHMTVENTAAAFTAVVAGLRR